MRDEGGRSQNVDGGPSEPAKATPSPPGRRFFVLLIVLTLLVSAGIVLLFFEYTRQAVMDYGDPATVPPGETLWMRQHNIPFICFVIYALLFAFGIPMVASSLLTRHVTIGVRLMLLIFGTITLLTFLFSGDLETPFRFHLALLVLFLAISAIILVRSSERPLWRFDWLSLAYLAIMSAVTICAGSLDAEVRGAVEARWDLLFERGATIIQALSEYGGDHGDYPDELGELVPEYLPAVPTTGYKGALNFQYERDAEVSEYYVLSVLLPGTSLNETHLWYWPEKDYDAPGKPKAMVREKKKMDGWLHTWWGT